MGPDRHPKPQAAAEVPPAGSRSVMGAIILALFALVFGCATLIAGGIPLAMQLADRAAVSGWPGVPAQVLNNELREFRDRQRRTYKKLTVRYRYTVAGQTYESDRVGLGFELGGDGVSDGPADWHQRLNQALAEGEPVNAFYNPRQPDQAVLEPRLRWSLVGFNLVFAVVFSGMTLGLLWGMRRAWRGPPASPDPRAGTLFCVSWLAAAWCTVTVPMAIMVLAEGGLAAPQWAIVLSPAIGLATAWWLQTASQPAPSQR